MKTEDTSQIPAKTPRDVCASAGAWLASATKVSEFQLRLARHEHKALHTNCQQGTLCLGLV